MAQKTTESNIYRRKLLNALLFFARHTKYTNTTKISKLLCFFDFQHFKETGYPSIGLIYYTFPKGPVPRDFWLEIKDGKVPEDFQGKLALSVKRDEYDPNYKEIEFIAEKGPDPSIFTPRERKILEDLAFMYKDLKAWEISEVSHLRNQPWTVTSERKGMNVPIDYMLAIDEKAKISEEEALKSLREYFEVINNFSLAPTNK